MEKFNTRLHDFEEEPPVFLWENISASLGEKNNIRNMNKRRSGMVWIAAAAAFLVFLMLGIFFKSNKEKSQNTVSAVVKPVPSSHQDSIIVNKSLLEKIINTPESQKLVAYNSISKEGHSKKYITIAGPEGQPVKISSKVATLILSADNEYPPKPVWDKKIEKWKQIMLNSTLSPTSTSLVDMLQSSNSSME